MDHVVAEPEHVPNVPLAVPSWIGWKRGEVWGMVAGSGFICKRLAYSCCRQSAATLLSVFPIMLGVTFLRRGRHAMAQQKNKWEEECVNCHNSACEGGVSIMLRFDVR